MSLKNKSTYLPTATVILVMIAKLEVKLTVFLVIFVELISQLEKHTSTSI